MPKDQPAAHGAASSQTNILSKISVRRDQAAAVAAKATPVYAHATALRAVQDHARATRSIGDDLVFHGGPVIGRAAMYNILVNCGNESCWGSGISRYETDMNASGMVQILNQYMGVTAYTVAGDVAVSYDTSNVLYDQDIYNIVYSVAQAYGGGYGAEYHVFLEQGVDVCSSLPGVNGCYAPDGRVGPFNFCAYHSSVNFGGIGHVIYSVEPYQPDGCASGSNFPNGVVADSTASVLSHEFFESMTDPDGNAWRSPNGGLEIGDLCYQLRGPVSLHGEPWEIQPEYSNAVHDCSFGPTDGTPAWRAIPGNGVAIGVGMHDQVWLLGENQMGPPGNYGIWKWNGTGWNAISGYANQIAVSPEGTAWVVTNNAAHNISRWNGSGWDVLPGGAIQIGVGSNNAAYILGLDSYGNGNYGIYRWNGSGWDRMPGYAASIAVSPEGTPWITTNDANHTISYWNGSSWVVVPGGAIHVGVGSNNAAYVLGLNFQGPSPLDTGIWQYNGSGWNALPGYASSIAVSPEGTPWILSAPSGAISVYR